MVPWVQHMLYLAVDNILEASGCQREDVEKLASSMDSFVKTSGF